MPRPNAQTATTHLILEARRSPYGRNNPETGLKPILAVRVVGSRAGRPERLTRDQIAVKVTVEIPESAFEPLRPTALVVVPESLIHRAPIEVEAADATEEPS